VYQNNYIFRTRFEHCRSAVK